MPCFEWRENARGGGGGEWIFGSQNGPFLLSLNTDLKQTTTTTVTRTWLNKKAIEQNR